MILLENRRDHDSEDPFTFISNTHPGRHCNERFTLSVKIHT